MRVGLATLAPPVLLATAMLGRSSDGDTIWHPTQLLCEEGGPVQTIAP